MRYSNLDRLIFIGSFIWVAHWATKVKERRGIKPLPDKRELDIMWTVATSTSIETGTRPHYGFAKMLYDEINDIEPRVELKK